MALTGSLAACENPFAPTIEDVSGRYAGTARLTLSDPPRGWSSVAEEQWRAAVTQDEDDWVIIRMNQDGGSGTLSFRLEAPLQGNGVVDVSLPNGGTDPDCGWMEPTYSRIRFENATMNYELDHLSDRCGTMMWDATLHRQ